MSTDIIFNKTVKIGTTSVAQDIQLELGAVESSRKIVLFNVIPNAHEYYGLGVNTFIQRYQVATTIADHVFYAAVSSIASAELFRVKGTGGFTSSGDSAITKKLSVGTTSAPDDVILEFAPVTSNRKIAMYVVTANAHQYYGFGVNAFTQRYQVPDTIANHVFYAATSSTTSNELFRVKGTGGFTSASDSTVTGILGTTGITQTAGPPCYGFYANATQSIPNNVDTVWTINTPLNLSTHSSRSNYFTVAAGVFTNVTGRGLWVYVDVGISWSTSSAGTRSLTINKNGAAYAFFVDYSVNPTGNHEQTASKLIQLNAGETISISGRQTSGVALTVQTGITSSISLCVLN